MRARMWWIGLVCLMMGSSMGCEAWLDRREEQKERWCRDHGYYNNNQQCQPGCQPVNPCGPGYGQPSGFSPYNNGCR